MPSANMKDVSIEGDDFDSPLKQAVPYLQLNIMQNYVTAITSLDNSLGRGDVMI